MTTVGLLVFAFISQAWGDIAASRDILCLGVTVFVSSSCLFFVASRYGSSIIVRQGSPGIIVGNCEDGCHLTVKFDEREDGSELCVNVPWHLTGENHNFSWRNETWRGNSYGSRNSTTAGFQLEKV